MISNDERREVAENLRTMTMRGCRYKEEFYDLLDEAVMNECDFHSYDAVANRLADIIEPEPERTCNMKLKKSGPYYDVWYFDCCNKEWSEARCDNGVSDYPGIVCPYCGAEVVDDD